MIPAAGYGSFAVAAKPAGNILTIRMMYASLGIVSPDQGHLQRLIGQLGRRLFHASYPWRVTYATKDTKGIEWPERIALSDGRFLTGKLKPR